MAILPVFAYQKLSKTKHVIKEFNHQKLRQTGTDANISSFAVLKQILKVDQATNLPPLTIKPLYQPTPSSTFRRIASPGSMWAISGNRIHFKSLTVDTLRSPNFLLHALQNKLQNSVIVRGQITGVDVYPGTGFISSIDVTVKTRLGDANDSESEKRELQIAARLPVELPDPTCTLYMLKQPGNVDLGTSNSVQLDPGVYVNVNMRCEGILAKARLRINGSVRSRHPEDRDTRAQADFQTVQNQVFRTQRLDRPGTYRMSANCINAADGMCADQPGFLCKTPEPS